ITASYVDASPADTVTATARADFIPPVITNVSATNHFGKELVSWSTDEPATSIVYYRSNGAAFVGVTNTLLNTAHSVTLGNLVQGQTYQYFVISADEAGNISTNNNNGAFYSFDAQ